MIFSVFINNIADELTNDILEQKNSRQNHPAPYKYTKIFSKTDYKASWLLTITQVSVKFFGIVNQFNIFFNGRDEKDFRNRYCQKIYVRGISGTIVTKAIQ